MPDTKPAPIHPHAAIDSRVDMDVVGAIEGADKSSAVRFAWDYLKHLEPLFAPYRNAPINLLEVGVQSGPSVRLWHWYFFRATIVGIDIDPACTALARDRVIIEIGSQTDAAFLSEICAKYPPTIFIDDGSHQAPHNIFTFEHVFPLLAPGGLYVVEDLTFHFGPNGHKWHGNPPRNAPEYFLDLARNRLARQPVSGAENTRPHLFQMIDSMQFIDSAVVIRKKFAARDLGRALAVGRGYIAGQRLSQVRLLGFPAYILKHDGPLAEAEAAAEAAIGAGGRTAEALTLQADIALRCGRMPEARSLLAEADANRAPTSDIRTLINLARMEEQAGLTEEAQRRLEDIVARWPGNGAARTQLARLRRQAGGEPGL